MNVVARHGHFVVLEHRGYTVLAAKGDLPPGAEQEQRVKFASATQNAAVDEIIDEMEGDRPFHRGEESRKEIQITGLRYIIATAYWCVPVYETKMWHRTKRVWVDGTYQFVRWNVGVESGVAVLCITTDGKIVFIDEFRHAARHRASRFGAATGFELPFNGLRRELVRGLMLPADDGDYGKAALRIAGNVAGVATTADSQVVKLGTYDADSGVLAAHVPVMLVTNVTVDESKMRPDASESIYGPVVLSISEVVAEMKADTIRDGFSHHAFLRALLGGHIQLPAAA